MIMEEQEKKSINHFVRSLHRDIGFFVIGLTIIYSISGIVLTYRDTPGWPPKIPHLWPLENPPPSGSF